MDTEMRRFQDIKDMLAELSSKARREARADYPFVVGRGKRVFGCGDTGDYVHEGIEFVGTKKDLMSTAQFLSAKGATEILIELGYDGYASPQAFQEGLYDPWASEAQLKVWNTSEGWLF